MEGEVSDIQNGPGLGPRMTQMARMQIGLGALVVSFLAPGGYGIGNLAVASLWWNGLVQAGGGTPISQAEGLMPS